MVDISIFDILDIPFDKPGKTKKDVQNVKEVIQKAINSKKSMLNNGGQLERPRILKQVESLETAMQEFFAGDSFSDGYLLLCEKRTEQVKQSFVETINRVSKNGNRTLSVKAVKGFSKDHKLKYQETVKPMFEKPSGCLAHVEIEELNLDKDYPKFPSNGERTHQLLSDLRGMSTEALNGAAPVSEIKDLYGLLAYFDRNLENVSEYKGKKTDDIREAFEEYSKYYQSYGAKNANTFISCCRNLCAEAQIVFKNDESRKSYDLFLIYKNEKLQDEFRSMRKLTKEMLKSPDIVSDYIEKILLFFPKVKTAYAIYNKEAGLLDDFVEPHKYSFTITCVHCHTINFFDSETDAKKSQGCSSCGRPLYKVCSKCKEKSPQNSSRCTNPSCGEFFPDEERFNSAIKKAEATAEAGLIDEARQFLTEAKIANPTETSRTKKVEDAIKAKEGIWQQPLKNLKDYITCRQFKAARQFASTLPVKYPGINIIKQNKIIDETLQKCDRMYESAKRQDSLQCANTMIDILEICSDYSAAVDYLQSHMPSPCNGLWAEPDVETGSIKLGWKAPNERGVTFRILRKNGSATSTNPQDGMLIVDELNSVSYMDESVNIGTTYNYTVYTMRRGVYSSGVSIEVVSLKSVTNVKYTQKNNTIHLTWVRPLNCSSVTVRKNVNGIKTVLSSCADNSIDDNLDFGIQAVYQIVPNYSRLSEKALVEYPVRITEEINHFTISASIKKSNTAEVRWNVKRHGVDVKIYLNGQEITRVESDLGSYILTLPGDGVFTISAKVMSGGIWKDCESAVSVTQLSVPECEVSINENQLTNQVSITVKPQSQFDTRIDHMKIYIRRKTRPDSDPPWVTRENVANNLTADMIIYASNVQSGVKTFVAEDEDVYYISVFAIYKTKSGYLISEPNKKRVSRPLIGNISWEITNQFFSGKLLNVTFTMNRKITERPGMKLCVAEKEQFLLSATQTGAVLVLDIPKREMDVSSTMISESFSLPSYVERGRPAFLFLTEKEKNQYISISWKNGFDGKMH